mmetsp:Transcript_6856/g.7587  ORF Transcript_6856/g.7587 Transcript_6856/m.7587 type:complete len:341 (+) Transcript_6856:29-1051(+)
MSSSQLTKIRSLLKSRFPSEVLFSFAYGSGMFKQANTEEIYKVKPPTIDFIMVVPDLKNFHSMNLRENKVDYSVMSRIMPTSALSWVNSVGSGCLFMHFKEGKQSFKYGVIDEQTFLSDMMNWDKFYISARLQKPVQILVNDANPFEFDAVLRKNRRGVLAFSILTQQLSGKKIHLSTLFKDITQLSYNGDPRVSLGAENRSKVKNIVEGNFEGFKTWYNDEVRRLEDKEIFRVESNNMVQVTCDDYQRAALFNDVPYNILQKVHNDPSVLLLGQGGYTTPEAVEKLIPSLKKEMENRVRWTNLKSYTTFPLVLPVGKTISYAAEKFRKGLMSKKSLPNK